MFDLMASTAELKVIVSVPENEALGLLMLMGQELIECWAAYDELAESRGYPLYPRNAEIGEYLTKLLAKVEVETL